MKFLVKWSIHPEHRQETLKRFGQMTDSDDEADLGGVTRIGWWGNLAAGEGVVVCESDDSAAVESWLMNWNGVADLHVMPVVDETEARATITKKFNLG